MPHCNNIGRLSIIIDDEDYQCTTEYFIEIDDSFQEKVNRLQHLIEDYDTAQEIFDFIELNFKQVELKEDISFLI